MKDESASTPSTAIDTNLTSETDPLLADLSVNKSEELFLQQNLLNIPIDDKLILQQQIDFINGKSIYCS